MSNDYELKWERPDRPLDERALTCWVQVKCRVCEKWVSLGEASSSNSAGGLSITMRSMPRHGCKWWNRLGPISKQIRRFVKRRIAE